jgi:hypothetical protein
LAYLCYLYPVAGDVPHLQVLSARDLADAVDEARRVARDRPFRRVELWDGDRLVREVASASSDPG